MVFGSAILTLWSYQNKSVRLFKSVIDSVNLSSLNKIQIRMCHDYNNDWNQIKTNPDKKNSYTRQNLTFDNSIQNWHQELWLKEKKSYCI